MSTAIPKLTVKYAWETGSSTGPIFDTPAEARANAPLSSRMHTLMRLYIDPNGRVVHTQEVPA